MKKTIMTLLCAAALASTPLTAAAHCGSCGVGGEKDTAEECAAKCADDADKTSCEEACKQAHDKDHAGG